MKTRTLYSASALTGTNNGAWMALKTDGREHRAVAITITGTATVTLVGRIDRAEAGLTIKQVTASELIQIASVPELQVRVTGASAATVTVSVDGALSPIS